MTAHAHAARSAQAPLTLEAVMPLARTLAAREAHRPDDIDDLVQVGLFAYHKAEARYRRLHLRVTRPWAFARTTIVRAVRGYYWQQREWQQRGEPNKAVGLEQVALAHRRTIDMQGQHGGGAGSPMLLVDLHGRIDDGTQDELFALPDYFMALERACGPLARRMVENLLMPSGDCAARILAEVQAKTETQQRHARRGRAARRHQPRGVKREIRISHRVVRDAMGLSASEWTRTMVHVRTFTRAWLSRS